MKSRLSHQQSEIKTDTFDADIEKIFNKLTQIIGLFNNNNNNNSNNNVDSTTPTSSNNLTKIQSYILKYCIKLMPILFESKRFSIQKISEFYIGFLSSKYVLQTQFLPKLIKSKLFEDPRSRHILMPPLCDTIKKLLMIKDSDALSQSKYDAKLEVLGNIVAQLMDVLEKKNIGSIEPDLNEMSKLLEHVLNTFLYFINQREYKELFGVIIISIMRIMEASHFEIFFEYSSSLLSDTSASFVDQKVNEMIAVLKHVSQNDTDEQLVCLKMLYTCKVLLGDPPFPTDWFDILILRNYIILTGLNHIAKRINKLHTSDFNSTNKQIWYDYFECMVLLAIDPCLQLETFNDNKRKGVLAKYNDIRVQAALEIKEMWFNLGKTFNSSK